MSGCCSRVDRTASRIELQTATASPSSRIERSLVPAEGLSVSSWAMGSPAARMKASTAVVAGALTSMTTARSLPVLSPTRAAAKDRCSLGRHRSTTVGRSEPWLTRSLELQAALLLPPPRWLDVRSPGRSDSAIDPRQVQPRSPSGRSRFGPSWPRPRVGAGAPGCRPGIGRPSSASRWRHR